MSKATTHWHILAIILLRWMDDDARNAFNLGATASMNDYGLYEHALTVARNGKPVSGQFMTAESDAMM